MWPGRVLTGPPPIIELLVDSLHDRSQCLLEGRPQSDYYGIVRCRCCLRGFLQPLYELDHQGGIRGEGYADSGT